eukprot:Pgem_evm1s6948
MNQNYFLLLFLYILSLFRVRVEAALNDFDNYDFSNFDPDDLELNLTKCISTAYENPVGHLEEECL